MWVSAEVFGIVFMNKHVYGFVPTYGRKVHGHGDIGKDMGLGKDVGLNLDVDVDV